MLEAVLSMSKQLRRPSSTPKVSSNLRLVAYISSVVTLSYRRRSQSFPMPLHDLQRPDLNRAKDLPKPCQMIHCPLTDSNGEVNTLNVQTIALSLPSHHWLSDHTSNSSAPDSFAKGLDFHS